METQGFSGDINFQAFHRVLSPDIMVKKECVKNDDELLFARLDDITNNIAANSTDYQIIQEMPAINQDQSSNNAVLQQELNKNVPSNLTKLVSNPTMPYQAMSADNKPVANYIRYKMQDGKHLKTWQCGLCSKEFSHQYTLMRHLPTHTDERKYQCSTCGKAFRQMSTLSQHKAIHSTERPYVCEICDKNFNRISTLISHRKTHTAVKPHRCHMCKKAFHQKGNLRNHIYTHTNERPYKCDLCEKGFNQMSNLMCHKSKAHHRNEKPKYTCEVCGVCFSKRQSLRCHEQYTHGMTVETPEPQNLPETSYPANAIVVEPIQTEAMRLALESNQTPFALLRPVTGIPVLVRVYSVGNKQMLVPATASDLKKHSNFAVSNKEITEPKNGNTIQIKVPVVATVIQQNDSAGHISTSILSLGPSKEYNEFNQQTSTVASQPFPSVNFDNVIMTNSDDLLKNKIDMNFGHVMLNNNNNNGLLGDKMKMEYVTGQVENNNLMMMTDKNEITINDDSIFKHIFNDEGSSNHPNMIQSGICNFKTDGNDDNLILPNHMF